MITHDDFGCYEKMEAFKIGDAYELHYCDIIFTVKFDPPRVIAISNCKTFVDEDDGSDYFENDECFGAYHHNNDSIYLEFINRQNHPPIVVELTLINPVKIHVECSSIINLNYHDYFDVDVIEIKYLTTKNARH